VISVELRNQISLSVYKGKLFCVPTEHALADIKLELLLFSRLFQSIEKNIIHRSFATAYYRFLTVFVHKNWLMLENDLLFQF